MLKQTQRYCRLCGRRTLHGKNAIGAGWGCLLTILTGGLFLLVWPLIALWRFLAVPWRCQVCGQAKGL